MNIRRNILWWPLAFFIAACAPKPAAPPANMSGFVRGEARVVQVDQNLGQVLLDISGRRVTAYWEVQTQLAQGGSVMSNGPVKPPVGSYNEPIPHRELFPAAPGDVIGFIGFQTGNEILLRGVEVMAH